MSVGGKITLYTPNITSTGEASCEPRKITISGVTLENPGLIWAIAEKLDISIKGIIYIYTIICNLIFYVK